MGLEEKAALPLDMVMWAAANARVQLLRRM